MPIIPKLTQKNLMEMREGQHFDRKSARIAPKDLAKTIAAFANAEGGILVIGIEDDGRVTGFTNGVKYDIEEFKNAARQFCSPPPMVNSQVVKAVNVKNQEDKLLILYVEMSVNAVIYTQDGKVYLRMQDQSVSLKRDQIERLEQDRGQRSFEDREVMDSSLKDVDPRMLELYRKALGAHVGDKQILEARGFLKNSHLTNAGVLLFSQYPGKYLPQARLRFLRYDGQRAETGRRINLIKEQSFDGPIPLIIEQASQLIRAQLREFQFLSPDGTFQVVPEYPEFAWFEGMINALTHRDYSFAGDHIRITMYDDRLEIFSPGDLPNVVTLDNMMTTRYSRNPKISRVLTELGWVKELNEGVKRIYDEMRSFYLRDPVYSEPGYSVLLTLENNIGSRHLRAAERIDALVSDKGIEDLSEIELAVLRVVYFSDKIALKEIQDKTNITRHRCRAALQRLMARGLVEWHGSGKKDPHQYYTLALPQ